jgi:AraC-like DNA-binding protein
MRKNFKNVMGNDETNVYVPNEDYIVHRVEDDDGILTVTEYRAFPGVWLLYRDCTMYQCKNPDGYPSGLLEITYCHEGRLEYDAGKSFFYLSEGDMVVNRSEAEAKVYCPTRHHLGISVIIDPSLAPSSFSSILPHVNVNASEILNKFCDENDYFIMRSTSRIKHIFSELYSISHQMRVGYIKIKILELLLFLKDIDAGLFEVNRRSHTKSQVELAQSVCEFVNANMDTKYTIDELAAKFFVSPSQLKMCFHNVYGESVYAHIRAYKIKSAAHELKTTDRSVSDIAHSLGYDNNSKFAKAFKNVMGVSPSDYRKDPTKSTI